MITAIIPYRPNSGRREGFAFVKRYMDRIADEVLVVDDGGDPFGRGPSINDGVARAEGNLLVICDADLVCPIEQLDLAIINVAARGGMVLPFDRYHYLTGSASLDVMAGVEPTPDTPTEFVMDSSVGGICVINKRTFNSVGGFDARCRGWGGEDYCFWAAASTLARTDRIEGPLYHLWHPVEPVRPDSNMRLMGRYLDALADPEAMRELIGERSC
jgi:hypothetical protein